MILPPMIKVEGISVSYREELVRVEGLEPPRLAAPEPKSGASTIFATPAQEANAHYAFVPTTSVAKLNGRRERKITRTWLTKLHLIPIPLRA